MGQTVNGKKNKIQIWNMAEYADRKTRPTGTQDPMTLDGHQNSDKWVINHSLHIALGDLHTILKANMGSTRASSKPKGTTRDELGCRATIQGKWTGSHTVRRAAIVALFDMHARLSAHTLDVNVCHLWLP